MSVTKECPGCGAELSPSDTVCPDCGTRWRADGSVDVAPATLVVKPAAPLGGKDGKDTRDYEWVGDLAYLDAAGGPGFGPFIVIGFVIGCVAAFFGAIRDTLREEKRRS